MDLGELWVLMLGVDTSKGWYTFCCVYAYSDYLFCVQASYENQQDIQLMRFADYFGRAFVAVSASQFPWAKMFKESTVSKMVDVSYRFLRYYSGIYLCM